MSNCSQAYVKVENKTLVNNGKQFIVKGAALLDDTTIWDKTKKNPNMNYLEERDYAFTAVGEINTVRLVLKMDYFIKCWLGLLMICG